MLRASTALSAFALFTLAGSALAQGPCPEQAAQCPAAQGSPQVSVVRASLRHGEKDIVETAVAAGKFNTLAAALKAAGLVDTLKGDGPFTVFAPTDEAFAKLPPGELEALLKPENKDKLVKILTHHVVSGKALETDDLKRSRGAKAVSGDELKFELVRGRVRVDGARVTGDYDAANGTIVAVDSVLLPN